MKKYELAKEYYEQNKDLLIPVKYETKEGVKLGQWVSCQRKNKKEGTLSKEKIDLLNCIEMIWDILEAKWQENYKLVKAYYKEYGNLSFSNKYKINGINIGLWLQRQRSLKRQGKLSKDKIDLLELLHIDWNPIEQKNNNWYYMYDLCKDYYSKYGNLYIQKRYETKEGVKLGQWLHEQRRTYKNTLLEDDKRNKKRGILSEEKIKLLNDIEMIWYLFPIKGCSFFEYTIYYYLKNIYDENEVFYRDKSLGFELDVYVPSLKLAFEYDGYPWHLETLEKDEIKIKECINKGITLYRFRESNLPTLNNFFNIINIDNSSYNLIFNFIVENLNIILKEELILVKEDVYKEYCNYVLKYFDLKWLEKYDLCLEYYEEYGALNIPSRYKTKEGVKLGQWISWQRKCFKQNKLSEEQIRLLEEIEMLWNPYGAQWQEYYELAKEYYEQNKDLLIPARYETKEGVKLGNWIQNQRKAYKEEKLSQDKIDLLESIGIVWEILDDKWLNHFKLAKKYYEEFGDLLIYTYYEMDGVKLGLWISNQRTKYKNTLLPINQRKKRVGILTQEQINLLESIGMIWSVK